MRRLKFLMFVVSGLFMLPIALVVCPILAWRDQRRMWRVAMRTECLTCGVTLGRSALRLADEAYASEMRDWRKTLPRGVRMRAAFRMAPRTLHAICPRCAVRYTFDEPTGTFVPRRDPIAAAALAAGNGR